VDDDVPGAVELARMVVEDEEPAAEGDGRERDAVGREERERSERPHSAR
jgi:hypothetical protein